MGAFDDDIKRRAGDFRPEPREAVWERIEKELDEKKRRRPLLWLWWMLPLLIAGGAILVWNNQKLDKAPDFFVKAETPVLENGTSGSPVQESTITRQKNTETTNTDIQHHTTHHTPSAAGKAYPDVEGSLPAKQLKESVPSEKRQAAMEPGTKSTGLSQQPVAIPLMIANDEPATVSVDSFVQTNTTEPILTTKDQTVVNDTGTYHTALKAGEELKWEEGGQTETEKKNIKQDKKGSWKLLAGVGMHNMGGQQLSLIPSAAQFNDRLGNNNSTTGGGFSNPTQKLSPPQAGPGIMLGMERQQPLGSKNRWSLNAGMHYQYQSMTIQTGQRRDSVLPGISGQTFYYSPGQALEHKGSQHRIHLLASMQWHIGKKRAFTWQNGLYGGLVLAHDYLLPYGAQVGWVSSKDQISKGYVGIETGFAFQPKRLGAGLYGQYNLSNSVKNYRLSGQYWRGIELRMTYKLHSK